MAAVPPALPGTGQNKRWKERHEFTRLLLGKADMRGEIKECAISNVQLVHPLRGTAAAERGRPAQAVGAVGCGRVGTTKHAPETASLAQIVLRLVEVLGRNKKAPAVPVHFIRLALTSP